MKKKVILTLFIAVIISCCCFSFSACDNEKDVKPTDTYVEIRCEFNDSVFYLSFVPGADQIKIELPSLEPLHISKELTVRDTSQSKTLIQHESDFEVGCFDDYGIWYASYYEDYIWFKESCRSSVIFWEITYKATGEKRIVRLIVERY